MIVEHEIIEQIGFQPNGRPLDWVCRLICELGHTDPMLILRQMSRAGHIALHDDAGQELQSWKCDEIWRAGDARPDVHVVATLLGSKWVVGEAPS